MVYFAAWIPYSWFLHYNATLEHHCLRNVTATVTEGMDHEDYRSKDHQTTIKSSAVPSSGPQGRAKPYQKMALGHIRIRSSTAPSLLRFYNQYAARTLNVLRTKTIPATISLIPNKIGSALYVNA